MSPPVRLGILLTVLLVAVIVRAQQPGSLLSFGGGAKEFPAEVVASVPPAPNVYGDQPKVRVLQLLNSMNTMWQGAFAAAGDRYTPPRIESRDTEAGEGCGGTHGGWAGVYCAQGERIVIDMGDHLLARAVAGDANADDLLGYVLAHEVGHHVQHLRGAVPTKLTSGAILRGELHAQCLAGVWGRAAGRKPPPLWSYGVDEAHGSVEQQRFWLERGYGRARPADCDAVWRADL